MMSKFKQLRLRLVVAVAVLLMAGMGTEAFAQCYTKNLQQAESLYTLCRGKEAFCRSQSVPRQAPDQQSGLAYSSLQQKNKRAQQ